MVYISWCVTVNEYSCPRQGRLEKYGLFGNFPLYLPTVIFLILLLPRCWKFSTHLI